MIEIQSHQQQAEATTSYTQIQKKHNNIQHQRVYMDEYNVE